MLKAFAWLLFPLGAAGSAQVAVPAVVPATAVDPLAEPGEDLAFELNSKRMTVPVEIGQAGPYRFVIDTGAQRTVISRELAGTLRLASATPVRVTAMIGTSAVSTVRIPSISVSTLGGREIEAPALEQRHLGAPGMLGIDSLQGHAVRIDFDNQVMTVTPSKTRRRIEPPLEPNEVVVRARSLFGQLVVTDATIRGTRVRVVLDTGSDVTMGNEALRRRLGKRGTAGSPITLTSVLGQSLTAPYTTISQFKLGGITINNLPIAFADAAPFRQFGLDDRPALFLGMDALKLFRRVNIDFANRELRVVLPKDTRTEMPGFS